MVVTLKNEIVGRILWEIKNGANYIRALDSRGISPTVLNRYIPLMEKEGLILTEIDLQTKRKILKLNEAKMDEINKLINAYLEYEKKEVEEKMQVIKQVIPEKERIRMASYFIAMDEEKRKRIEKMLEEILEEGEAK